MRPRDNQRSKVYAWEARCTKSAHWSGTMKTLDECDAYLRPIWGAERGRYGRARVPMPPIERPAWGQRSALAHASHRITLPLWARNPWTILHEAAHRLTPTDEGHGPRFVGVLMGLACRHLGYVAEELMATADEMGVKYHVRSIGSVPIRGPSWHVERAVRNEGPMTEMDLACWCSLTYLQVRGAAMHLIKIGRARWLRKKLTLVGEALPPPEPPPKKPRRKVIGIYELARTHGIDIEQPGGSGAWFVYPGAWMSDADDPNEGDHVCDDWSEVRDMVKQYVGLKQLHDSKKEESVTP